MSEHDTPPARVAWVKKTCPLCKSPIEIQEAFLNREIDCPTCNKPILIKSTGKAVAEGAADVGKVAGGCGCSILGLLLWLFIIGVVVIVAVMFVTFVLTKLGIMRVNQ